MSPKHLLHLYQKDHSTEQIIQHLKEPPPAHIYLKGIAGSVDALIGAAVFSNYPTTHLFVLSDKEDANFFYNDLENLLPTEKILFFPHSNNNPYHTEEKDTFNVVLRTEVLNAINNNEKALIITYPEALSEKVVTQQYFQKNTLLIHQNEKLSLDFITALLFEYDFERVDFVVEPGQFAVRGGIVDVFSFANDHPFRIEFFDEEVHSLRTFDMTTQLSVEKLQQIIIIPNIEEKTAIDKRISFLKCLQKNTLIWYDDISLIINTIDKEYENANNAFQKVDAGHLLPENLFIRATYFKEQINDFSSIESGQQSYFKPSLTINYRILPQPTFNKKFDLLFENLKENINSGYTNIILTKNERQVERLKQIFEDIGGDKDNEHLFSSILISIHNGFVDKNLKLACYTDHQIFERYHRPKLRDSFKKAKQHITFKELVGLQPGDYVTHIDHGIGKFSGLEKIEVEGKQQEAIRLIYKDNDILYVSIHSLHRISKYAGKEGAPRIDKIGANHWKKLKQKTKNKVKEIAFDLIKLYAKRKAEKGFKFSPDTYLQHELEASFIYEDTRDQLKSTHDVKKDMEASSPMDRLICGDVGFGKTEIAIRAAFKAVADSKQVAILAPTTILTLQHYHTFKERLKNFPCNVDYINRFKSQKKQKETLNNLANGKTDILIGTHRLISKDVKYKDLGLMIIDEEQKFGVAAKDNLKTLRANIDTLTLTATPIPRTLQFSLMGARDLSIINTPPPNRYPIHTELHVFNKEIIKNAILHEVSRGGQVFFVHNRIKNIIEIEKIITKLCPDVSVAIGHGQMKGHELEEIMLAFIEGEYDVLLSTTIIESGLDIPNANTIIINNAHSFGLSDLHQLRGRVGRTNKKAFCYLLSPPITTISDEARKRLKAIEQFTDLGSGFNIAMRDLDIRGAGNLLGGEQSGFIAEIGFETYHKILDEAIQELREDLSLTLAKGNGNESFLQTAKSEWGFFDCQIDTDLEILIPDDYVENIAERLSLYKELDNIKEEEGLSTFEKHLTDRFGIVPKQTEALFHTVRLRWLAKKMGFEKLILKRNKLIGYFISNKESYYYQSETFSKLLQYVQRHAGRYKMKESNDKLTLTVAHVSSVDEAYRILGIFQK